MSETEGPVPVASPEAPGEPMSRGRELIQRRIAGPLVAQLRRGATPTLLAWSIALGAVLSLLPVPGTTTALCLLAAFALRLNPVAMQVANFVATPVSFALLLPFLQAGQRLFGDPPLPLSRGDLQLVILRGAPAFISQFGVTLLHAIVVWALCAAPLAAALHLVLRPLLLRGMGRLADGPIRENAES